MKPSRMSIIEDCLEAVRDAYSDLEAVKNEEEEAYDNLPEGLQDGEKGDLMQDAIASLEDALGMLDDAISSLEEVTNPDDVELIMEKGPWDDLKVGDEVRHKSWGNGVVTLLDGKYCVVKFSVKEARFSFPDAFERGFLFVEN